MTNDDVHHLRAKDGTRASSFVILVSSLIPATRQIQTEPAAYIDRALVVSIHDVCPGTRSNCERILADLARIGIRQCSLLVIPNYHGQGHFLADLAFCDWLRAKAAGGHEIVIHGYYHWRERRPRETVAQKLTTRFYTADEGEFFDIDRAAAVALVNQAITEFLQMEIETTGFIAPAWLLSDEAEKALRDCGRRYTTRLAGVLDLQTGRFHSSQSLVWSVRSGWRRTVSLAWNALLFRAVGNNPLLRISIHPPDIHHPLVWNQICRFAKRAQKFRSPMTYQSWLERQASPGKAATTGTKV